jgi:hypothetical protein
MNRTRVDWLELWLSLALLVAAVVWQLIAG